MRQIARLASLASLLFTHPEQYTDLRLSCVSRDRDARSLRADLEAFLTATAAPLLPAGLVNAGPSSSTDHLRYEKALLGGWVRRELGRGTRS